MPNRSPKRRCKIVPIRILLPVVLTMVLFVATIFGLILPLIEAHMMARKREMIHQLTQTAVGTLDFYARQALAGQISNAEAQKRAIAHLRQIRFGPEQKDYFWINDMQPVLIMHPYRPDLEGRDISNMVDSNGKKLFVEFVRTVQTQGAGFVDYQWQWQDDPHRVVPKISYVSGFAPWNWVVGTGIYVEDVRAEISAITRRVMWLCSGILVLIMALSAYIVAQSARSEKRRLSAGEALLASEAKYRLLAETAQEFIIALDENGAIYYVNRAWIEAGGYTQDELLGSRFASLLPSEQRPAFAARVSQHLADDRAYFLYETGLLTKSGQAIPVEMTAAHLTDPSETGKVLVTARDITEKKRAEEQERIHREQLFQADKMATLGTLVSGVAHEINNPIMFVMLNAPILKTLWSAVVPSLDAHQASTGPFKLGNMPYAQMRERMPRLLDDLVDGAKRVKAIVSDLKDFARQESSAMTEDIDINEVVRKATGLVANLVKKSTNRFEVDLATDLPLLRGNAQRIEQVVINLLVNSCQALPDKERLIALRTRLDRPSGGLTIAVADEGTGMSSEVLQRIKDPFYTTKRESGGTGLGLAIAERIVEDHGGRIQFVSQPGRGTTAEVWIPIPQTTGEPMG
jgi:PAS domain S-box-containing protein